MRAKLRLQELERGRGVLGTLRARGPGAQMRAEDNPIAFVLAHAERGQERPAAACGESGRAARDARRSRGLRVLGRAIQEEGDGLRGPVEQRRESPVRAHPEAAAKSGEERVGAEMPAGG